MKSLFLVLFVLLYVSSGALASEEGLELKCTWIETEENKSFFTENSYITFNFVAGENDTVKHLKILDDTFLNRCEVMDPKTNCEMAFTYNEDKKWDHENTTASSDGDYAFVSTQVWRLNTEHGPVGGIAEISGVNTKGSEWVLSGDDGSGTWFTETFNCEFLNLSFFN